MQGLRRNQNHSRRQDSGQKLKGIADYQQLVNDMEAEVESRLTRLGLAEGPSCYGDSSLRSDNYRMTPISEMQNHGRRSKAGTTEDNTLADRDFMTTRSLSFAFQQENLRSGSRTNSHGIVLGQGGTDSRNIARFSKDSVGIRGTACKRKSGAEQLPRTPKHQEKNSVKSAGNNFFGKHLGCASASHSDALAHPLPSSTIASTSRSRLRRQSGYQLIESSRSDGISPCANKTGGAEQERQSSFAHETTSRSLSLAECLAAPGQSSSDAAASIPSSGRSARGLTRSFSSSASGSNGHPRIRSLTTEEKHSSSLEVSSSVTSRRGPRDSAMVLPRESSHIPLQSPPLPQLVSREFLNLDISEDLTPASPSFEIDDDHQHERMSEGLAEIFLALEHLERDEHLNLEQLCMLEPTLWFGGMGLYDQHNDWRLDVDGMSYEELLALEERIGDVCTGLTEEDMKHRLKASKYISAERILHGENAKCSICQDEYTDGDELGAIDCGHVFHSGCVKQWLTRKNQCPICKATA